MVTLERFLFVNGKPNGFAVNVGVERLMGFLPIRLGLSHDEAYLFRDNIRDK
jgi:hypothetical protein